MNLQIELKNVSEELDMVKNEMEDEPLVGRAAGSSAKAVVSHTAGKVLDSDRHNTHRQDEGGREPVLTNQMIFQSSCFVFPLEN